MEHRRNKVAPVRRPPTGSVLDDRPAQDRPGLQVVAGLAGLVEGVSTSHQIVKRSHVLEELPMTERKPIEAVKDKAYWIVEQVEAALEAGEIDETEWHRRIGVSHHTRLFGRRYAVGPVREGG